MLESNLTRSANLAFQTDLIYLDIGNDRVGIRTNSPGNFALDVAGDTRIQGNQTITGNLEVQGTTTTIDTANMSVEDPLLLLNSSASAGNAGNDSGIMINRSSSNNAVFYWDEGNDTFKIVTSTSGADSTEVIDTAFANFQMNDLTVNSVATDGLNITDNKISSTRSNDDIRLDPAGTGAVDVSGAKITNVANSPSADTDAANKKYVDDQDALIASDTLTLTNKTIDANGTGNAISNIDIGNMTEASVVLEAEGIAGNDNDTTLPTSASVKDYVDTAVSAVSTTAITQLDTNVTVSDSGSNGSITMTADGTTQVTVNSTSVDIGNFTFSGNKITQTASNADYELDNTGTGNFVFIGTTGIIVPMGTTAERPTAQEGVIRYNTDTSKYEVSQDGSTWTALRTEQSAREVFKEQFTGDGSTVSFGPVGWGSSAPTAAENLIVYIDGVMQEPDQNYTADGSTASITITEGDAPHAGARVVIINGLAESV